MITDHMSTLVWHVDVCCGQELSVTKHHVMCLPRNLLQRLCQRLAANVWWLAAQQQDGSPEVGTPEQACLEATSLHAN